MDIQINKYTEEQVALVKHMLKVSQVLAWDGALMMYKANHPMFDAYYDTQPKPSGADILKKDIESKEPLSEIPVYAALQQLALALGDKGHIFEQLNKSYRTPSEQEQLFWNSDTQQVDPHKMQLAKELGILKIGRTYKDHREIDLLKLREIGREMNLDEVNMPSFFILHPESGNSLHDKEISILQQKVAKAIANPQEFLDYNNYIDSIRSSLISKDAYEQSRTR